MKKIVLTLFWLFIITMLSAQGTLQYNQAKIIGASTEIVPIGKVWKVTSVYGVIRSCRLIGPCYIALSPNSYAMASQSGLIINGESVPSRLVWERSNFFSENTCTNDARSFSTTTSNCTCNGMAGDLASDPNVLPIWLPAGTSVSSLGSSSFVSVLEFNIIP